MLPLYSKPAELEKLAKEKYAVPQFLMMENAAKAMADFILKKASGRSDGGSQSSIAIVCGKGNNGGDGYALARLLQDKLKVTVIALEAPAAEEATVQYKMCTKLGIKILKTKKFPALTHEDFIVDCIYGTGFHGELSPEIKKIIKQMNASPSIKIACDIPSGLAFQADYTITMGSNKLALFSDKAKAVCGEIITADLGIARERFEGLLKPEAYLIQNEDLILPLRKDRAAHKGTYGHTAVLCGDKAGASILCASAAMNFGSGLTTIIKNTAALSQFKISPSLMLSDSLPARTSCLALGSGFSEFSDTAAETLVSFFQKIYSSQSSQASRPAQGPAAVLDAGMLTSPKTPQLLKNLNRFGNARIILTPHLGELSGLLKNCKAKGDISVTALADCPESKIAAGLFLNKLFPRTTVIMKSANTFIACQGKIYIVADGCPSLAKGGSGDILAGLAAALLAQGYSAKDAAITAAGYHASLSKKLGNQAYNLTPEKLLKII